MFDKNLFSGKRILVTGGGSGLGKEMSKHFLNHGAEVIICGRRDEVLQNTVKELTGETKGKISSHSLDIRDSMAIEDTVSNIFDEAPIDGLGNNAAGNFSSRTQDLSPNGFNAIASIVFHGTFNMTNTVGKKWIELKSPGTILSITTIQTENGTLNHYPTKFMIFSFIFMFFKFILLIALGDLIVLSSLITNAQRT